MFITYDDERDTLTVVFQNTVESPPIDIININPDTQMVVDSRQQPVFIKIHNARANTSHPWQVTAHTVTKNTPKTYISLPPRPDIDDPDFGGPNDTE